MDIVSLIIPIFNSSKYLKKCLESVINQTYPYIEIICIDDGSLDNSLEIIKEYKKKDKRIKIICTPNRGVSHARNLGIKESNGKYIAFLDSDDYLEKNYIEILLKDIQQSNVDVVRCNYNIVENSEIKVGEKYTEKQSKVESSVFLKDEIIIGKKNAYVWLLLCKAEIIKQIKFNENITLMEDVIFYIELLKKVENVFIENRKIYNYVINLNSATRSDERIEKNLKEILVFNKEVRKILDNEEIIKINSCNTNFVIQLLSGLKVKKYFERKSFYKKIFEDNNYLEIFSKIDPKINMKKYVKLLLYFGIKKQYFILDSVFKIKKVYRNIKNR